MRMLGEADLGVCEASLDALLTLVDGQRLQSGGKVKLDFCHSTGEDTDEL